MYKVMSWAQPDYSDAATEIFSSEAAARSFIRDILADGYHAELSMVLEEFEPEPESLCQYNGITPGVDCPAFI